ncbi:hypothetical protein [Acidiferrobacter sp.]|uniref:hypothetical protein n=1 Tax=Acidiferrobacter sp. TaxID=1872107 RepID=UPI0026233D01|nr:hypothetical protein [Acidiferrobacter sp.]
MVTLAGVGAARAQGVLFFGVPVVGATRATVNAALQRAGFKPSGSESEQWFDTYRVNGQPARLQGASRLMVDFTQAGRFAVAQYTFPSFDNPRQIKDIMTMVTYKYGRPTDVAGNLAHGPVVARWREAGGAEVKVWRGVSSTTTYLDLEDVAAVRRMRAQYPHAARALNASLASEAATGKDQWQPPTPSDVTSPDVNRPVPMRWEIGIVVVFLIPALGIVFFAHFLARVTRVPPSMRAVLRASLGRMGQWFRRPAWRRR